MRRISIIPILLIFMISDAFACNGKLLNPITDICWSCIFPISIGGASLKSGISRKDTPNPSNPVCLCNLPGSPVLVPGIAIGFWEPIRLIEIVREPMCLLNLNGMKLGSVKNSQVGWFSKDYRGSNYNQHAFYHMHVYVYPILGWLNILTGLGCAMQGSSLDLAYMSELDPTYDSNSNFLDPETILFSNPISHAACIADCTAATVNKMSLDKLWWCGGCHGSLFPLKGKVIGHTTGVNTSSLLAEKALARLHRLGLAKKTATSSNKPNGNICHHKSSLKLPKSQYRLQMTYPVSATKGDYSCNPIGMSDSLFNSGKEFPGGGEDFSYLVWRKKNCCFL